MSITIVVPVKNEKESLIAFCSEVKNKLAINYDLIFVYDNDQDSTLEKKDEALKISPQIKFVKNDLGAGFINALKTGFASVDTPYVVLMMADLSDTPETITDMIKKLDEGHDVVVASRYVKGGDKIGGPRLKSFLSRIAGLSLNLFTDIPVHDATSGFILYRKSSLDKIKLESTGGFEVTIELLFKSYQMGLRIGEVPTVNRDRFAGKSNFKFFSWFHRYLFWYLKMIGFSWKKSLLHGN